MGSIGKGLEVRLARLHAVVAALPKPYLDTQRLHDDVAALLEDCSTMVPQSCTFVKGGRQHTLFILAGVLPISFKGVSYNIPVTIYLDPPYPNSAPRCFVTPTAEMCIRHGHTHVDQGGMIRHRYLENWHREKSSLVDLVPIVVEVFSAKPPVHRKRQETMDQRRGEAASVYCTEGTRLEAVFNRISQVMTDFFGPTTIVEPRRSWTPASIVQEQTPLLDDAGKVSTSCPPTPADSRSMQLSKRAALSPVASSELPAADLQRSQSERSSSSNASTCNAADASTSTVNFKRSSRRQSDVWQSMKEEALHKVERRARRRWERLLDPLVSEHRAHLEQRGHLLTARGQIQRQIGEAKEMAGQSAQAVADMTQLQRKLETDLACGVPVDTSILKGEGKQGAVLQSVSEAAALHDYLAMLEQLLSARKISVETYVHEIREVSRTEFLNRSALTS
mmetsp:Transcript_11172/g.25385  ORF Transcript_11172/g.25385 Transcript_11172/m.25385 type:complete len:449 (-) Transcript_11172:51-1397(-)